MPQIYTKNFGKKQRKHERIMRIFNQELYLSIYYKNVICVVY